MTNLLPFAEYGIGIFSLVCFVYLVYLIVDRFKIIFKYIEKRDDQLTLIVTNHLHEQKEMMTSLMVSNEKRIASDEKTCESIRNMMDELRNFMRSGSPK